MPPKIYLIPSSVWSKPNNLFVSRDYEGKKSKPEWGLNLSKKNLPLLTQFEFEKVVQGLEKGECLLSYNMAYAVRLRLTQIAPFRNFAYTENVKRSRNF
jgi:hypothetical protein